ncbi:hypothetical protein ACVW1A_004969 [Bradyrhizobium sp. LB1.3]
MRKAASGLFNWAAEAGRDYVTSSPCANLPKLDPEHPRTRVLSEDEIGIFWHGLDRDDLPWDRRTRLALKFELVTMLRSRELLGAQRDELFDLDGDNSRFDVPLKRVKKRRMIQQPLSDLAVEIINEALTSKDQQFVFESPTYKGQPIHRKAMADALRGTKHEKNKDKSETPGLCELFGLKPFTPHDLRRTAATVTSVLTMHGSRSASITRPSSSPNRSFRPLLTRCTTTPSESRRSVLCWTAWRPSSGGLSKHRSSTPRYWARGLIYRTPFPLWKVHRRNNRFSCERMAGKQLDFRHRQEASGLSRSLTR